MGGGQLGRMFAHAAQAMGYQVAVLEPSADCPAGHAAEYLINAQYTDSAALAQLAGQCAAVTTEFENVPATSMAALAETTFVAPSSQCVSIAQDRILEKKFFVDCAPHAGVGPAPHLAITGAHDISAVPDFLLPGILKTVRLGYDGKGQARVNTRAEIETAFKAMGGVTCVLEKMLPLAYEVSVLTARGADGATVVYPIAENVHRDGILFTTTVPGPNVSCWPTAAWSSTKWRRARTTAATTRWMPASPASSRSKCARRPACRWATCASIRRPSC
jgi:5-(carboxyamino)imidazole ribonucleotide synthase